MHLQYELLTQWLHLHPHLGGIAAFIVSFAESVAIIGSIIPGSVTMTAIGILAGSGVLPMWTIIIYAIFGAIFGDGISYILGYYFKDRIRQIWPFSRYPKILDKGEMFFFKHGGKSVFIGRFVGPVRAMVPVIAGMLNMKPKRYYPISITSATLWAPAYMLPGILLGAISLEMPPRLATELILFILLLLATIWLIAVTISWFYRKTHNYFSNILDHKWQIWKKQSSTKWLCDLLRHAERPNKRGQLMLAINTTLAGIIFIAIFTIVITCTPIHINTMAYHLFRGIRTPTLDKIMIVISSFADPNVLFPLIPSIFIWFAFRRKWLAAWHWLAGGILCSGGIFVFKNIFYFPRPPGILNSPLDASFPSGHTALSVTLYGLLAFFSVKAVPRYFRKYVYGTTAVFCTFVAISRLYLGLHWFTDVLGGSFLALAALGITVISYHRFKPISLSVKGLLIIAALTLTLSNSWYLYNHYKKELKDYLPYWKTSYITEYAWWDNQSNKIPIYRQNRFGTPSQIFNIQWAGSLPEIKATLYIHGWKNLRAIPNHYLTNLKNIAHHRPVLHHSILPKLFNDQPPILERVQYTKNYPPLILRMWQSSITILPNKVPLWVGTIEYDTEHKYLFFFKHKLTIVPFSKIRQALLPILTDFNWQIKSIMPENINESLRKKQHFKKIILIKPNNNNVK